MITACQVIYSQPYQWEKNDAHVKFLANNKSFFNDILTYKIETYPGKHGGNKITKRIPANMYPGLIQWGGDMIKK